MWAAAKPFFSEDLTSSAMKVYFLFLPVCLLLSSCASMHQGSFDAYFAKAVIQNDTRGVMSNCTPSNAVYPLNGTAPIAYAASYGNEDMIDVLYANGASMGSRDAEGHSLAYAAAANGHRSTASKLVQLGGGTHADISKGTSECQRRVASRRRASEMQAQAMMWLMAAMIGGGGGSSGGQSEADKQLQMGQALSAENAAAHYNNQPLPHAGVGF